MEFKLNNTYSGFDGISQLDSILRSFNGQSVLLVTGKKSYFQQPFYDQLNKLFKAHQVTHFVYEYSNPDEEHILNFQNEFEDKSFSHFVAIGGGSVIDFCKLIINHLYLDKIEKFIAIPTTAGTGSEHTQFATYYQKGIKKSVDKELLKPTDVILDPIFISQLPRSISIYTALDALSQCIESYWNCHANEESKYYAKAGINRLTKHLVEYIDSKNNENSKIILEAASYSGAAIQLTRTTAAHALSYGLTWNYHIPHGLAVYLCLPALADFNQGLNYHNCQFPEKFEELNSNMKVLTELLTMNENGIISQSLKQLLKTLKVDYGLINYNIHKSELENLSTLAAQSNRATNNPRKLTKEDLYQLLVDSYS